MQPASAVIVLLSVSSSRMRFMRPRASTISLPAADGVAPPHMPVLPPCGTTPVPVSAHSFTTAETSSVLAGRTTAGVLPRYQRRQSTT